MKPNRRTIRTLFLDEESQNSARKTHTVAPIKCDSGTAFYPHARVAQRN
jgi:hypothetical protein